MVGQKCEEEEKEAVEHKKGDPKIVIHQRNSVKYIFFNKLFPIKNIANLPTSLSARCQKSANFQPVEEGGGKTLRERTLELSHRLSPLLVCLSQLIDHPSSPSEERSKEGVSGDPVIPSSAFVLHGGGRTGANFLCPIC